MSTNENYSKQLELIQKDVKKRLSKKVAQTLHKNLKTKQNEKDVENAWRDVFTEFFITNNTNAKVDGNYELSSVYGTDGFISPQSNYDLVFATRILLEFKDGTDLTKSYDRARIMAQVIHYMKRFKEANYQLPTVIIGADENQAFVLYAPHFYEYLDREYSWGIAPSSAYKNDSKLMKDLIEDANTSVWPYQMDQTNAADRYDALVALFTSIVVIAQNPEDNAFKLKVSPAGITGMFDEFRRVGLKNPDKVNAIDSVNLFMQMLLNQNSEEYYFLPNNRNKFHLPGDVNIDVFGSQLETFFNHYDRNLTISEKDELISISDRLIDDTDRRQKGDFWTPTIWAIRANEMLENALGEDYRDKYLVWDPAAGTRNLTRDYRYSNLYISTFYDTEIKMGAVYNPEVKSAFQYDFLNDDVHLTLADNPDSNEWKMPNELFNALVDAGQQNKGIVFYTNPPYGTATNVQANGTHKSGISVTEVNKKMKDEGYGKASQQLYAQFFYRVMQLKKDFKLNNVVIAFFTKPRHLFGGGYWETFNNKLFDDFGFVAGNMFNSGEFSDTSDTWPITFSIYSDSKGSSDTVSLAIEHSVWDSTQAKQVIVNNERKHVSRVSEKDSLSRWVREISIPDENMPNDYPQLSSALKISNGRSPSGKLYKGSLGYMVSNSNNVGEGTSNSGVWIVSSSAYKGHGFNVLPDNFERAVVNFAARRSITPTWINDQENFKAPDEGNATYKTFVNDSLVFALFENASYQAAYRGWPYTNVGISEKWINQWFWIDIDSVREILVEKNLSELYDDTRGDVERFVANEIQLREFSAEAQAVLDAATKVWKDTLDYRSLVIQENPEYMLDAWDAGWFQIKQLNSKYPVDSYDMFREQFKTLKSKIEDNVYNLGMLLR